MIGELIDIIARGIPATASIDFLHVVPPWKGSAQTCNSDIDYYGYTDLEFTICDRRGREATWISDKMTAKEHEDVNRQVAEEIERWDT